MNWPVLCFVVGLIFALLEEFQARGRSFGWWGVVLVCIGLLWAVFARLA